MLWLRGNGRLPKSSGGRKDWSSSWPPRLSSRLPPDARDCSNEEMCPDIFASARAAFSRCRESSSGRIPLMPSDRSESPPARLAASIESSAKLLPRPTAR
eukprot:scaffold76515_cov54-Phaeocystis_antarctica.AAC.3